jgi:thymidylate synthase (FAD)
MKIVPQSVELLWITPDPYKHIEMSGRVCYKSEDKITEDSAVKFCNMIKQRGHESVVEHAVASFKIVCDRGVSHEIVRHRIASYSQESTRYCNYSKDKFGTEITVILPPGLADEPILYAFWEDAMKDAEGSYLQLISRGVSPQIARSVLPTCLKTEIVMTANFREWMHFIKLRTSPAAHPQIREIANQIRLVLEAHCPTIFVVPDHSELVLSSAEVEALKSYIQNCGGVQTGPDAIMSVFRKLKI